MHKQRNNDGNCWLWQREPEGIYREGAKGNCREYSGSSLGLQGLTDSLQGLSGMLKKISELPWEFPIASRGVSGALKMFLSVPEDLRGVSEVSVVGFKRYHKFSRCFKESQVKFR